MKEAPKIRFVKASDLDYVIQLCKQHAIYERSDYNVTHKREQLSKHLFSKTPSMFCLVIEHSGNIIGYATYMKQFSTWDAGFYIYMDCLYLTEKARGFGLGRKLMNRIKQEASKLQYNQIQWQTPDFNLRAITFYNRIGAKSKTKKRYCLKINNEY